MKKYLVVLFLMFVTFGCSIQETTDVSKDKTLEKIVMEENYIVLDVRTKKEYEEEHVVDAIHIPYDEIDEDISLDKSKTIIVYCRSGRRSGIATTALEKLGYEVFDYGVYDAIPLEKE